MAVTYTIPQNSVPNLAKGTVTATDDAITLQRIYTWGGVGFQVTGTWTGTITFEATIDGSTWVALLVTPSTTATQASTTTTNAAFSASNNGYRGFRARFSTASSGTPTITISYMPSQA